MELFLLDDHVECYFEVPEGFKKYYLPNVVLMLLRTLYGMIQAAYAFWTTFLNAMWHMKYNRSKADPCLYYRWTKTGLALWLSWLRTVLYADVKRTWKKPKMVSKNDSTVMILAI
jgi:hypothetical protein